MNAKNKSRGLGRGLDALLGGNAAKSVPAAAAAPVTNEVPRTLPVKDLQPGKYQPRTRMDEASLNELAASIAAQGLVQPIIVRPLSAGASTPYEIIAGERRWRASQIAGLKEVPVHVHHIADENALAMALIEYIQREDLNPLEEAQGLRRLIDEFNLTHQQAAEAVGRSRSAATNLLRLLELAQPVQDLLMHGRIDMGHARALLALAGSDQIAVAQQVVLKALSVRE
ncbi:MAG: ParB/RepB/Spo0J family partition protein, partial [Fluviibacter sp.]